MLLMKAVIYARVSSAEQLREGFSIAAQRHAALDYAKRGGFEIVAEFSDDETAKITGRTDFSRMVAFLQAHPDHALIVEKTDRLYRNIRDYLTVDELGVEVHFVKEGGRDRKDSDSRFMHLLRVGMARKYVENLSEEVKKGMRQKCAEGGWPTYAPVGYLQVKDAAEKKRTGGIIPDPAKAPLIVEMFEAAATRGYSLGSLARLADRIGLRGARGGKFAEQQVANLLANTAYYGEFGWGGQRWRGIYEPLITRDLFDRANRAMAEGRRPKTWAHTFAYTGVAHCGECGGPLTGDLKKGRYVYYSCRCMRERRDPLYPERLFDDAMRREMARLVIPSVARERVLEHVALRHGAAELRAGTRAARIRARLTEIDTLSAAAYEDKLLGKVAEATWRAMEGRWREEERRLRAELLTVQPSVARDRVLQKVAEPFELVEVVAREYLQRNQDERGALVRTCCSNFLVTRGSISIHLRSPFDYMAKLGDAQAWLATVDQIHTWAIGQLAA